jgi:hypothetical protein
MYNFDNYKITKYCFEECIDYYIDNYGEIVFEIPTIKKYL